MSFWNKIVQVFTGINPIILTLEIILFTIVFYYLFCIPKLGGASWVNILTIAVSLVVVLLAPSVESGYLSLLVTLSTTAIITIVLFQSEVRRNIFMLSFLKKENKMTGTRYKNRISEKDVQDYINEIVKALFNLSKQNIGALIILSNDNIPQVVLDSGVPINAQISSQLIESIFNAKSPLHDGAMLINNARIQSVGCFLQLSRDTTIPKELGTRHRAGIGITETTNVTALIVSEETGVISIVQHGKIQRYADHEMLQKTLLDYFWKEL